MNILLVDNGTTLLSELETLIPGNEIVRVWDDLADIKSEDFNLIILSGGSKFEIEGHEDKLENELELIKNTTKPLIGICYGCELITKAFGGTLEKSPNQHKGIIDIKILEEDSIFDNLEPLRVYENHSWLIKELPPDFIALAKSDHGYEIIKHRSKPIYGFQFHPEQFVDKTIGDEMFLRLTLKLKCS
ncbi:MAG: gamma-glutamyl-gamma-aminobutyrate hydrolase family protein [Candidatus Paceibacterota bacterium]|jgi:GMP synthase-like glutamine amidotransferase